MDFLKLVQKKEHKIDNKIAIFMVILLVLIVSLFIFWPGNSKQNTLAYLPTNTSFYYHFTNKKTFSNNFFKEEAAQEVVLELENILGNNFLNLQEILWFRTEDKVNSEAREDGLDYKQANNYLLSFSRLPKAFLDDFNKQEQKYKAVILEKNILLLSSELINNLEPNKEKSIYFEEGLSIYWKKNKAPEFLMDLSNIIESAFVGDDVLLNWQESSRAKNKISLLENSTLELRDFKNFLALKDFDLVFGFNNSLAEALSFNNSMGLELTSLMSSNMLKAFFDSLPYYNLNSEVIENRILNDAIVWQKEDGWILASNKDWQEDILDLIKTFEVEEVTRVLSDGTAYVELLASEEQNITEHQINGQKVLQIDKLFIWDIGGQHYLSNKKSLIEDLSSNNRYLDTILDDCLDNKQVAIGDFIYIKNKDVLNKIIVDYPDINNIEELQMVSYATSTIRGLNICF